MVHANEPGLPRTDVSGSEFEVGAPTSEEEAERKKSQAERAPKSPLAVVLESWLLSILPLQVFVISVAHSETIPGVSGNDDVSTGVETDGQLRGRHIVVTRSLVPLAGGPQHDVPEAVHSRGRSRELLERAFDDGNSCAQLRKLLVLFQDGSKFLPYFFTDQFVTDPAATVIIATGHQLVSLCRSVCEEEKAHLMCPLMISEYFPPCLG